MMMIRVRPKFGFGFGYGAETEIPYGRNIIPKPPKLKNWREL